MLALRYKRRPSELVAIKDACLALDFDMAIMARGMREENRQATREVPQGSTASLGDIKRMISRGRGIIRGSKAR